MTGFKITIAKSPILKLGEYLHGITTSMGNFVTSVGGTARNTAGSGWNYVAGGSANPVAQAGGAAAGALGFLGGASMGALSWIWNEGVEFGIPTVEFGFGYGMPFGPTWQSDALSGGGPLPIFKRWFNSHKNYKSEGLCPEDPTRSDCKTEVEQCSKFKKSGGKCTCVEANLDFYDLNCKDKLGLRDSDLLDISTEDKEDQCDAHDELYYKCRCQKLLGLGFGAECTSTAGKATLVENCTNTAPGFSSNACECLLFFELNDEADYDNEGCTQVPTMSPTEVPTMSPTEFPTVEEDSLIETSADPADQDPADQDPDLPASALILDKAAKVFDEYLTTGNVKVPFCLGAKDKCYKDNLRAMYGSVTMKSTPYCSGMMIPGTIPDLTLGSVIYLAAGRKENVFNYIGPLKNLGIKDATIEFVSDFNDIALKARGSPRIAGETTNPFIAFIKAATESIVLEVSATASTIGGGFSFEARTGTKPIKVSDTFKISDAFGNIGPSVFSRYSIVMGVSSSDAGFTMPLLICAENCGKKNERWLGFKGELYYSQEVVPGAPPAMLVNGDLTMDGWWDRVFGMPFLHISNVVLGLGFDMAKGPLWWIPMRVEFGGQICFGALKSCMERKADDYFVHGAAYVGFSAVNPTDNYVMAMMSEAKVATLFGVLGDTVSKKFHEWSKMIPTPLLETGITPFDPSKCVRPTSSPTTKDGDSASASTATSKAATASSLDLNCYSYFSFNPLGSKTLTFRSGTVTIPQGIQFAGRLSLLGTEFAVKAAVCCSDPAASALSAKFLIHARMSQIDLKVLTIGGSLNKNNKVVGEPEFLMDFKAMPPSALIAIDGAVEIPVLQSYASVHILLDKEGFEFAAKLKLLYGVMETDVSVKWDWAMKSFEARLKPTTIWAGLVKICAASDLASCRKDAVAIFKTVPAVMFEFDAGIKIPLLLMESSAHIKFGNGEFTADISSAGFLGIMQTSLKIVANAQKFELTAKTSLDFRKAVETIGSNIKNGIRASFREMLKIDELMKNVNDYIKGGINKLCAVLQLSKVGFKLGGKFINVCDGMKKFAKGVTDGIAKFLKPVLKTIESALSKAVDAVFGALGTILDISGETAFRVTIAGAKSGEGLLELDEAVSVEERMRALESLGLSATTAAEGNVKTTLCFGLGVDVFGNTFKLDLEKTCLSVTSNDIKNMWNTLTKPISSFVTAKANDVANRYFKDNKGNWDPSNAYNKAMSDLKSFFTDFVKNSVYDRGVGKIPDACPGRDKEGARCYDKCRSGYSSGGLICYQNCNGFGRNDGAYCAKPGSYGRGAGRSPCTGCSGCSKCGWRGCSGCSGCSDCSTKRCRGDEQGHGALCYPKCRGGYHNVGCCTCSPNCPSGMKDIGVSCEKKKYGRGGGHGMSCASNVPSKEAGLCYKKCKTDFVGVGFLCWRKA